MNTLTTKLSVLLISLTFSLSIQAQNHKHSLFAYNSEDVVKITNTQIFKYIALNPEVKSLSTFFLEGDLEILSDVNVFDFLSNNEDQESEQLEDWMFEDLIVEEEAQPIEDWMFEELIVEEETQAIEDWMFEELSAPEEEIVFEDWMFDTEYFNDQTL